MYLEPRLHEDEVLASIKALIALVGENVNGLVGISAFYVIDECI